MSTNPYCQSNIIIVPKPKANFFPRVWTFNTTTTTTTAASTMAPSPYPLGPVTMETSLVSPGLGRGEANLGALALQQPAPNHQQVSLSLLIEFLVQRVYHDLTVLVKKESSYKFLSSSFHTVWVNFCPHSPYCHAF